jgi:hypothetical protein
MPEVGKIMQSAARVLEEEAAFDVSLILGERVRRGNLIGQLLRISQEANTEDCTLFYFSGHSYFPAREREILTLTLSDSLITEDSSHLTIGDLGTILKKQ